MRCLRSRTKTGLIACVFSGIILIPGNDVFAFLDNNFKFTPKVNVIQAFDDNVTYVKSDRKENLVTNLNLGFDMVGDEKTQNLIFSGNIQEQLFSKDTNFNNMSEDFSVKFQKELSSRDRFSFSDSFAHTQDIRTFDDAFGRTSGRYSYYNNQVDFLYSRDIAKQLAWDFNYANQVYKPSRSDLSDSYLNKFTNQANYLYSSAMIFSVYHAYSLRTFNPGKSSDTHTFAGAVRRYLTAQLFVDLSSGLDLIKSFDKTSSAEPFFSCALTDQIDENSRVSLSYIKQHSTNYSSQDILDSWRTSLSLMKQIFKRWGLNLSAFYGEGEYAGFREKTKYTGASVALNHDFKENVQGSVGYSYSSNVSNFQVNDYRKNYFFAALSIKF